MTVRANKPAFNFREKLKELERPIGIKGNELMRAETAQDARDLVSAGRKNMVINGDIRISQRYGTTATTITSGGFVIDRYRCEDNTDASTTHQQVTDAPPGFHNSLKVTVTGTDTSVAAGDFHYFRNIIEGYDISHLNWGSSNAKTVTLSFWVKSSVVGDHGASLWNNAFDRSFPFHYTINNPDTWEYKSITVPGCPDGTWESGTSRGINIGFVQSVGSTYQGPPGQWNSAGDVGPTNHVNLTATNGATWYITGIQLEVGRNATDFEHRPYAEELALCQRYFYINGGEEHDIISQAFSPHTTEIAVAWPHPTEMRAAPTVTVSGTNSDNTDFYFRTINNTGFSLTGNGRELSQMTKHHASIWFNGMSGVPAVPGQVRVQNDRTAFIHLSAEL